MDPHGNISQQLFDDYHLLVKESKDALRNTTVFEHDYTHLQATLTVDPNGNQTKIVIDPLGRQIGVAAMGNVDDPIGDSFDQFAYKIDDKDIESFFQDPCSMAHNLLGTATGRTIYQFCDHSLPVSASSSESACLTPSFVAHVTRHEHANSNTPSGNQGQVSVGISYLDGSGRTIQEAMLTQWSETSREGSWNISGSVLHDNKGQPVKKFQPFPSISHHFQPQIDSPMEPAITSLQDALGRLIGVLNADHTWTKTEFTPWNETSYDAGDTVLIENPAHDETVGACFRGVGEAFYLPTWYGERMSSPSGREAQRDKQAAEKSQVYHDTPTMRSIDAAGQAISQWTGPSTDRRQAKTKYTIWGHPEITWDTLGRKTDVREYDMLGNPLHTNNMDQGQRWLLGDCQGAPLLSWSDRGIRQRMEYDELRRPTDVWVKARPDEREVLAIRRIYGEELVTAPSLNLNGQLWKCYDQSGLRINNRFDFKGNCTQFVTHYAREYKQLIDWSTYSETDGLEEQAHSNSAVFNAMGQPVEMQADDVGIIRREYDDAGRSKSIRSFALDGKTVTSSAFDIEYEPDNQLKSVTFGNGSQTSHTYDRRTRRKIATQTVRIANQEVLQDLSHTYDCMGKIVCTVDQAQQNIFFLNEVAPPVSRFWYDFLGQLVKASGREQVNVAHGNSKQLKPPEFNAEKVNNTKGDGRQMICYEEFYTYDKAGNILRLRHVPGGSFSGWTRHYSYKQRSCIYPGETNNRLTSTSSGGAEQRYEYTAEGGEHGCMTKIPGYSSLSWNYADHLQSFSTQRVSGDATAETTWYVYNAGGSRVRKVTEGSAGAGGAATTGKRKETRYLPTHDVFTTYNGSGTSITSQITTMTVADAALGGKAFATLEEGHGSGFLVRYQAGAHLELDDSAVPISYEEYSPFGVSTYQYRCKGAPRKYRFASYERDKESGLYHCGLRYYAPWLARWISADPLGTIDGPNLYAYVGNDPVNNHDPTGTVKKGQPDKGTKDNTDSTQGAVAHTWAKFKGGKNHLKGADFDIRTSDKDTAKEITLQSDNPIGTALQLLSPAINDESGEFGAGFKTLGVGDAKNELLHGFNGSSNKQLLLPRRDGKLDTIGADDASHSSPARGAEGGSDPGYKYEFRIDWDERKQARHVNVQVSRGKQSYNYAIFHKKRPDGPEPIVHDQLLNALHEGTNTLTQLQDRFATWVYGKDTGGEKVKNWVHSEHVQSLKNNKSNDGWNHTKEMMGLTAFGRLSSITNKFQGEASSSNIATRLWVWAQHRLDSDTVMQTIDRVKRGNILDFNFTVPR